MKEQKQEQKKNGNLELNLRKFLIQLEQNFQKAFFKNKKRKLKW